MVAKSPCFRVWSATIPLKLSLIWETFTSSSASQNHVTKKRRALGTRIVGTSNYDVTTTTTQKKNTIGFILWAKQRLCTCIMLFRTFLWHQLHDCELKPPNSYDGLSVNWTWRHSLNMHSFVFSLNITHEFPRLRSLTRAHSRKRQALVTITFSNFRGGSLWELWL